MVSFGLTESGFLVVVLCGTIGVFAIFAVAVSGGMESKSISLILLQKSCSDFRKASVSICRAACLISGLAKGVEEKLLRNKDKLENIKVRITEVTISKISRSLIFLKN